MAARMAVANHLARRILFKCAGLRTQIGYLGNNSFTKGHNCSFSGMLSALHARLIPLLRRQSFKFMDWNLVNTRGLSLVHVKNYITPQKRSYGSSSDYNDDRGGGNKAPLRLMDMPERIWPHPIKTIKNYFFSLLIKSYYDPDFSQKSFLSGAEQAMQAVSTLIRRGNFDDLDGLVTRESIREIRDNFHKLNQKQRNKILVDTERKICSFIYEIGMIFDDQEDKRFVEITAVLQTLDEAPESGDKPAEDAMVCNYRFIREYTKGVDDDWTINQLNHFSVIEVVKKTDMFQR